MIVWIAGASCLLAVIPGVLFVRNLSLYRPLPKPNGVAACCSVLIPARNEESNIEQALRSVLASDGVELEVVVLDDGSTDRTAEIVASVATADPRVRLEVAQSLPNGWCGKNFACHQLAQLASHPLLIFMDADVRVLRVDSLARLAAFVEGSQAALVSGVPRQETGTWMEKLIIPLIHFVLLAFLPLGRMRSSTDPRFAAACGQILAVRRTAYEQAGGHEAIAGRIHDAVALTRRFRARGFATDLFDATDSFGCRMYQRASEVWQGFAKNAHEGLASPRLIGPATLLLFGGQILPLLLLGSLVLNASASPIALLLAGIGTAAAYLPRMLALRRFGQPLSAAVLHPLAIGALLAIQWFAFFRVLARRPASWKGRTYTALSRA
jgi:hypothetical protein